MPIDAIFGLQFALSLIATALIARWYVAPWLSNLSRDTALAILVFPHAFRHIGMSFVVPGLAGEGLPATFALEAAYGDLASALAALVAVFLLRMKLTVAIPVVWAFNLFGTVDLVNALRQAEAIPHLGVTWYIPTFIVPVLLISHFMIFARLLRSDASTHGTSETLAAR